MAAIVCHGLPSCLDSQLVESRIHNLCLPSPKPLTPQPIDLPFKTCFWESNNKPNCEENIHKPNTLKSNSNEGSWSSIESLSKSNVFQVTKEKEQNYVHPNVKLSWLQLSPKSLELCTENLGNETGTDIPESGFELFSSTTIEEKKEQRKSSCQNLGGEKVRTKNFPPPLKSMRGSESLKVRPHREGGRLVIEVTKVPSSVSCFQAERSNGRLRLSFWSDNEEDVDDNQDFEEEFQTKMSGKIEDYEEEEEEDKEEEEEKEDKEVVEECIIDNENENEEGKTRVSECIIERKVNGWNIESEVRMENYERGSRRRCKEGKHENNEMLLNWGEPIWLALATS